MQKIQEFIGASFVEQKNRVFLWVPFFFSIGIAIYFSLRFEPTIMVSAAVWAVFSSIVGVVVWRDVKRGYLSATLIVLLAICISVAGFFAATARTAVVYTPMLTKKLAPVMVQGVIETIEPLGEGQGSRVVLTDVEIEKLELLQTPKKIRLKVRKDEGLLAGQTISVLAGLNPPSPPVAPGAFDFQRMAFFKQIGAVGFTYNTAEVLQNPEGRGYFWESLRQRISNNITTHTEDPQRSVLIALMTGQRQAVRDEDWKALRQSGLAHMLAISGLHVGMVAGVLFFFSRFFMAAIPALALKYPIKKYAALIALVGACFYTVLVGATIPTQRALIMTGLAMVAIMLDRSPFSLRLVALAAICVLIFTPESLTSVSFQMSFAAVTALICFYEAIRPVWMVVHRQAGTVRKLLLYVTGVSLTTVIASVATGLFSLFHFQNFAVLGVVANIVAVPIVTFVVMPFIVLSYLVMPFGLSSLTLPIAEEGTQWVLATAHWVSGLDGAVWLIPVWQHNVFIMMVCCAWFFMVWKGRFKWFAIPCFVLLTIPAFLYQQPTLQISARSDLVSIRDVEGSLWLSTGRTDRYTASNWLRRNGQAEEGKRIWPKGGTDNFPFDCDALGCRGEVNGQKIAVSFSQVGITEDCQWADVILSNKPIYDKKCGVPHIIDFFDVKYRGAHALWVHEDSVKVQNVESVRGNRPWIQKW